jgi:hypothetical protein
VPSSEVSFCGEGPRSRYYGRTAALRLRVQPCDEDEIWSVFFFIFPSNGARVEWSWQGETEVLGEKPVPVPLCQPQIPMDWSRDQTRASAVRGRRLTAWAMARPSSDAYSELRSVRLAHKFPANFFLQLRGPATALSRKYLHDLTTARHFKSFL